MSLTDLLKQHNELKDKLMPPYVQSFIEMKVKTKPYTDVLDLIKNYEVPIKKATAYGDVLNSILVSKSLPITSISLQYPASSFLQQPNSNILTGYNLLTHKLIYSRFDFSKFNDLEISNDDIEEIKEIQIDESSKIKRIITDIYKDNSALLKISPREFEEMIAEILRSQGFETELTKQTRDNGYDILAIKPVDGHAPLKYLVECKRFTNKPVGVEIIRGFKNVVDSENANMGIIVATSYFTRDAYKKKKETPYILDFRDKDAVMDWVNEYSKSFKLVK